MVELVSKMPTNSKHHHPYQNAEAKPKITSARQSELAAMGWTAMLNRLPYMSSHGWLCPSTHEQVDEGTLDESLVGVDEL